MDNWGEIRQLIVAINDDLTSTKMCGETYTRPGAAAPASNNWTWQLTITIQNLYFYDSCVYEYVLQNNLSK
jgi:hypothetical protein